MRKKLQGQSAVLLFVLLSYLIGLAGCGRQESVRYEAGSSGRQTEAQLPETQTEETENFEKETQPEKETQSEKETQTEGYVYVCGAVQRPGVYPIHSDMRVFEAVGLAGGFLDEADKNWLNLAGHLQDGQQLYVYTADETARMEQEGMQPGGNAVQAERTEVPGGAAGAGMAEKKVNLNTADLETLMTLPGIGRVKAEEIIRYREEHGGFSRTEEIQNIPGIKQAVFSKIEDRIAV